MTSVTLLNASFGGGPVVEYLGGDKPLDGATVTVTVSGLAAGNAVNIETSVDGHTETLGGPETYAATITSDGSSSFTAPAGTTTLRAILAWAQATPVTVSASF